MSPAQFAIAVGADPKWIRNARQLLGRPETNEAEDARWLGVVHVLHDAVSCSLATAAYIADLVVAAPMDQRELRVPLDESGAFTLTFELHRAWTLHLARLSRALVMPPPERRGRRAPPTRSSATTRATAYGIDVERLRAGLGRRVAERLATLDDNAAFLAAARTSLIPRRGGR